MDLKIDPDPYFIQALNYPLLQKIHLVSLYLILTLLLQVRYSELPDCVESNSSVSVFESVDDCGSTSESVLSSDYESITDMLFLVATTLKHGISVASSS